MNKRVSRRIREIDYVIKHHEDALKKAGTERVKAYADSFLTCSFCAVKSKISTITLINLDQWDPDTGSPCGGYSIHYEYRWECPKCEHRGHYHSVEYEIPHEAFKNEQSEYEKE